MKRFILILFVSFIAVYLPATNTFEKSYGGSQEDEGFAVRQTTDGGYIIAGHSITFTPWQAVYLIRTDPGGDTLWTKLYSNLGSGSGRDVIEDDDGGFVICGGINYDVLLLKVDSQGNFMWEKTFGGFDDDEGYSLLKTADHGFILCGYTRSLGPQFESVYWIKTDSLGNLQWQNTYGGHTINRGLCIRPTFDGNYIISGYTDIVTDNVESGIGSLLVKINENGDTLWTKTYTGTTARSLVETDDHGYLVCFNNQGSSGTSTVGLLRTDQNGVLIWTKQIELSNNWNEGRWIEKTYDGNFIIGGVCGNVEPLSRSLLLLKTNDAGDTLWSRRYPGVLTAAGNCVQATGDHGFIICGYTSAGPGQQDVYLVKTDENGIITGLDDPVENREFCFYPNPAGTFTILNLPGENHKFPIKIRVFDLFGREVKAYNLLPAPSGYQIDVSWLPPGLYAVLIERNGIVIGREKLIINQ